MDPEGVPQETNFDCGDGLEQVPHDTPHEREPARNPTVEPTNAPILKDPVPPSLGMAARNVRVRTPPENYIPTMKENKYAVAVMQIAESVKECKRFGMAQMSVKLMSQGVHRRADIVGMIMAQLSTKAAIKKWRTKLSTP